MKKIAFAFFAFLPLVMLAPIGLFIFGFGAGEDWFINAWIAATAVWFVGWCWYVWDVWHNARVPPEKRALWTVVLVCLGPYATPFYFWFYVR